MTTGTPTQVLRAAEEAERLYQEQIQMLSGGPTGESQPTGETVEEVHAEATGATGEPEETLESKLEKAEQRYKVLQGKYSKEVPEFAGRLADQSRRIQELTDEIGELKTATQTEKVVGKAKGLLEDLESDPDITWLKTEYPDVYRSMGKALEKLSTNLTEKIQALSSKLSDQEVETKAGRKNKFYEEVESIPDYQVVNTSQEFNDWLDNTDPLTGFPRRSILNDACEKYDYSRVRNFFSEFKRITTPVTPVSAVKPGVGDVAITRATTKSRPVDQTVNQPKIIKASEVKGFYDDVQKGRYKGREADMAKREAEIDLAIAEARIVRDI
jgi:hypothetical protein